MLSRRGKALRFKVSFAGSGLLERMRSTTFALLGITAAMGLGLVASLSQQSWPLLPGVPVPGFPSDPNEVHDATPVQTSEAFSASRPAGPVAGDEDATRSDDPPRSGPARSDLGESRQTAAAEPSIPAVPPGDDPPAETPPPEPAPVVEVPDGSTPVASSPAAPPAPSSSTGPSTSGPAPVTSSTNRGKGKSSGKASGKSSSKAKPPKGSARSYEPPPPTPAPVPAPPSAKKDEPGAAPVPEEGVADEKGKGNGQGNASGHSK